METGDKIPEFLGLDAQGNRVTADMFAGKPLIIYFYPKDNTPGCTAEACSLRDGYEALVGKGFTVIGISKDSPASHMKFADRHSLPFLLLSDEDTVVNQAFGVWQLKRMAGREYMGTMRTTFVTDTSHRITHIIRKVDTKKAAEQLLKLIDEK